MIAVDPAAVIGALREVAETIILPRFKTLADHEVRAKTGKHDLVTVADEEGEHRLGVTLPALLPGSKLIGEESVSKKPALIEQLAGEDWVWIVDPVDGTLNFVNGSPVFCTMVALTRRGETVWGFIHDCLGNRTLWAEAGAGAFVTDGAGTAQRRHMPMPPSEELSTLTAALYDKDLAPLKGKFGRITRIGCAGLDYWAAVDGRAHVVSFRNLKPWDHAPGLLIHAEAGGYHRLLNGEAYFADRPGQTNVLCTPTREIWNRIVAAREKVG
ncbi:MAG: inositol monophosphatase [Rhodospirillaceae bacterium]|nr:inositol monophosphatase [Rhodospirillaceae bacterium]